MAQLPKTHDELHAIAPKLMDVTKDVLFGDVWERAELSKRDRSLVTVAAIVATYRPLQLAFHVRRALENGVTKTEIVELITHLAFYVGWPAAISAVEIADDVFKSAAGGT